MDNLIKAVFDKHSPFSRRIVSYEDVESIPEGVIMLRDTDVTIYSEVYLYVGTNVSEPEDLYSVLGISLDGQYIEMSDAMYFKFRSLMKDNDAILYDYRKEVPKLGIGK